MKKLKLKALELGAKEVLTREQLKNVLGGFDDAGSKGSGKKGSGSGSGSGKRCGSCSKDNNEHSTTIYTCDASKNCACPISNPDWNDC